MAKKKVKEIDLRDAAAKEIDLRDRLRFAADSLAADFGDELTADHAEALVFSSAEGLIASASVTEFVPILAERRARLAIRSGVGAKATTVPPQPQAAAPPAATPSPDASPPVTSAPRVAPLLAVSESHMARLRDTLEQVRVRVASWRAEIDGR